jgi:hypothetical protein
MIGNQPEDAEDQALLAFLAAQRDAVLSIVAGLDEAAWHRWVVPSGLDAGRAGRAPRGRRVALVPGGRGRRRSRAAARG